MGIIQALSTLLPLAVTSGINLYATVLVVGLCIRYDIVSGVPTILHPLATDVVILVAAIFYMLEFLADKIPFVDNLWDFLHTFIRPLGAAVIAFAAVGEVSPEWAVVAALVSGGAALVSHGGKAGSRVALNVTSPAENVSNIGVSLAEDVAVGVLAVMALKYPYIAAAISLLFLIVVVIVVPPMLRWSWFNLSAIVARVRGLVRPHRETEPLPEEHRTLLPQPAHLSTRCKAHNIKGANGRSGYLSLSGAQVCFSYHSWFHRARVWCIERRHIVQMTLKRGIVMDVLEMACDEGGKEHRPVRFVFTRDRSPLVDQVVQHLERESAC